MGQDRVLCCFVIDKCKDFGSTIHSPSLADQTLPRKESFYLDQAHAAQVRISLDGIIEWYPYRLERLLDWNGKRVVVKVVVYAERRGRCLRWTIQSVPTGLKPKEMREMQSDLQVSLSITTFLGHTCNGTSSQESTITCAVWLRCLRARHLTLLILGTQGP